jgi:hypothetical protein
LACPIEIIAPGKPPFAVDLECRILAKNTVLTDGEQGCEVRDARVFDQLGAQAIENQPAVVEASGEHGMVLTEGAVAYQYYPQIINRKAGIPQRDVFGDRVPALQEQPGIGH